MKKILIILSLILINASAIFAQNSQENAKAYYYDASEQYKNGNYSKAIVKLEKAEKELGKTNAIILNLKIKALYEQGEFAEAKKAIKLFDKYSSNTANDLKKETYAYILKIEEKERKAKNEHDDYWTIAKSKNSAYMYSQYMKKYPKGEFYSTAKLKYDNIHEADYKRAIESNTIEEYNRFLRNWDSSKYYDDIKTRKNTLNRQRCKADYQTAINSNSIYGYETFLSKWKRSSYNRDVENRLANKKDEIWQQTKEINTLTEYQKYLQKYPNSKYATMAEEIVQFLTAKKNNNIASYEKYNNRYPNGKFIIESRENIEELYYNKTVSQNSIKSYEEYLYLYPNGAHLVEINEMLENKYYELGNNDYKLKKYDNSEIIFNKYLESFPNGKYSKEISKKIKSSKKKNNQVRALALLLEYDTEQAAGISFASLSKSVSVYGKFRISPTMFKFTYNSITSIDDYYESDKIYSLDDIKYRIHSGRADEYWDQYNRYIEPSNLAGKNESIGGSIGLTFKLAYPLWLYAGIGLGYYPHRIYYEVLGFELSKEGEDVPDDEIGINTDGYDYYTYRSLGLKIIKDKSFSILKFYPEFGLYLNLGKSFNIKTGLMYKDAIIYQIGIGINLSNKKLYD